VEREKVARIIGIALCVLIYLPLTLLILSSFRNHLRPRPACNECAAVANLRTINTAQFTYLSSSGGTYGSIADLIAAGLLDDTFIVIKAGYKYSITLGETGSIYTAEATPASAKTGRYGYYTVPDAVVRYSTNLSLAPAGRSGRSVQ
jgi:hypothetical protein